MKSFRYFDELDAYTEALGELSPQSITVPVLGRRGTSQEDVERLLSGSECSLPRSPRCIFILFDGSVVGPIVSALAKACRGSAHVIHSIEEIDGVLDARKTTTVVLCGLAAEISEADIFRAHDATWRASEKGQEVELGVLSGENLNDISWVIAKGLTFPGRTSPDVAHLRLWPALDSAPAATVAARPEMLLLRQDAVSTRVIPLLVDGHAGVMSVMAHGRDDVLHLQDTVICAAAPLQLAVLPERPEHLPVCAFTGRCFRSEIEPQSILRSQNLRVDVVFANSCMGFRASDGLFPTRYLLPFGFLRGIAAAYVGAPNLVSGMAKINDLFHGACAAGLTVGAATRLVNEHLRREESDLPYFTVMGLPWIRPVKSAAGEPHTGLTIEAGRSSHHTATPRGSLDAAMRTMLMVEETGQARHLVYASVNVDSRIGEVSLPDRERAAGADALGREFRQLGRAIDRLAELPYLGLRYSRQNNVGVNLRDQVSSLAKLLHETVSRGDTSRVRRRLENLRTAVEQAERTLGDALFERGTTSFMNFDDLWTEVLERRPLVASDRQCPYCTRQLFIFEAVHPIFEGISRRATLCNRCGVIVDEDGSLSMPELKLLGPDIWYRGESVELELRFMIPPDFAGDAVARVGVHTENCERNGVAFPGPSSLSLQAGEEGVVRVLADVGAQAHMHQEYLRAFVILNGSVGYASRPVWIRPARSRSV